MNGASGTLRKMRVSYSDPIEYQLPIGAELIALNPLLGKQLKLCYLGAIHCIHCGRKTRKSFSQGYCYPCFTSLAQCDMCTVKPELCHYEQGTCREPEWGRQHCFKPHTVYLSNASGLKVGITRGEDPTTRWIDQGAAEGLAIRTVPNRLEAGRLEVALKQSVSDRTDWRKMLKSVPESIDLAGAAQQLLGDLQASGEEVVGQHPSRADQQELHYPIIEYPAKISAHNFDKNECLAGELRGIKGQYLMVGDKVVNVRKYAGYEMSLSVEE